MTTLSGPAARALEQVKTGLYILYGASYFTDDEWIKIDGLIHKGQYVFTQGPRKELDLMGDDLMGFGDTSKKPAPAELSTTSEESAFQRKPDTASYIGGERPVSSPSTSPSTSPAAESSEHVGESGHDTPAGSSPHPLPEEAPAKASAMYDFSLMDAFDTNAPEAVSNPTPEPASEPVFQSDEYAPEPLAQDPVEIPIRQPVEKPKEGGLAYYTKDQLEELKAFNATLTRAKVGGKKASGGSQLGRGPDSLHEHDSEFRRQEESFPSPTPTQSEANIQSWASEVNSVASTPRKLQRSASPPPQAKPIVEAFVKAHGKMPRSINDISQPNNPQFIPVTARTSSQPARSLSRTSNVTFKTANQPSKLADSIHATPASETRMPKGPGGPNPAIVPNKIFVAQSCVPKANPLQIEVRTGDKIQVIKHVSGIMHFGVNQRTKEAGQFSEKIFQRSKADAISAKKEDFLALQRRAAGSATRMPSIGGLDRIEGTNAAAWDEVPRRPRTTVPVQAPKPKPLGGLMASRFAVLDDESDSPSNAGKSTAGTEASQGISRDEMSKMFDEKFAQILAAQQHPSAVGPSPATKAPEHSISRRGYIKKEPPLPVIPKTETCYFWATPNMTCRFTPEECRDVHGFVLKRPGEPITNLRMGQPTWGALADYLPPKEEPKKNIASGYVNAPEETDATRHYKKPHTCWYWAHAKCEHSAAKCKYLHENCANGIAHKPNGESHWRQRKPNWNRWRENRSGDLDNAQIGGDGNDGEWEDAAPRRNWEEGQSVQGFSPPASIAGDDLVLEEVEEEKYWEHGDSAQLQSSWGHDIVHQPGNNSGNGGAGGEAGWNDDTDKYKPPHIKELERRAQMEAVGW